jgi:hypothetical protein
MTLMKYKLKNACSCGNSNKIVFYNNDSVLMPGVCCLNSKCNGYRGWSTELTPLGLYTIFFPCGNCYEFFGTPEELKIELGL